MKTKNVITAATFQCKQCGERITLTQEKLKLSIPKKCKCGCKDFELVCRKLVDFVEMPKEEYDKVNLQMHLAGISDGELAEAKKSLQLRFTERELQALIFMFWFSEPMQSIRNRLGEIEKKVKP